MKQNLLNVSYHIAQYTSIIADLRGEIQRLKCKIDEQGGRGQARGRPERGDIRHIQGVCWELSSGSPPSLSQIPRGGKGRGVLGSNPDSGVFWLGALGYSLNCSVPSVLQLSGGILISVSET